MSDETITSLLPQLDALGQDLGTDGGLILTCFESLLNVAVLSHQQS